MHLVQYRFYTGEFTYIYIYTHMYVYIYMYVCAPPGRLLVFLLAGDCVPQVERLDLSLAIQADADVFGPLFSPTWQGLSE